MNRVEELILQLIGEGLSEEEADELDRLVESDPVAAHSLTSMLELDAALRAQFVAGDPWPKVEEKLNRTLADRVCQGVLADLAVLPPRSKAVSPLRRRRWPSPMKVALLHLVAMVLIGVGWFVFHNLDNNRSANPVDPPTALESKVASISGQVEAFSPTGEMIPLQAGAVLPTDVTIRTTEATGPLVLLISQATRVEVAPGSMLRQIATGSARRYFLSQGDLRVVAGKGDGIEIQTSHVDLHPVRAECRVRVSAGGLTEIGVTEGTVNVTQRSTGRTAKLAEGFALLAADDADMLVMSLRSELDRSPQLFGREHGLAVGYGPTGRVTLLRPRGVLVATDKPGTFETLLDTVLVRSRGSIYSHITFGGVGAVSPAHSRFVGCSHDGVVWVWDVAARKHIAAFDTGEVLTQACRVDAPSNANWVAVLRPEEDRNRVVRWWSVIDRSERKPIELGASKGRSLSASPDGRYLAVGIENRFSPERVILIDGHTGERLGAIENTPKVPVGWTVGRFRPDGSQLVTVGHGGILALWSVPELRLVTKIVFPGEPTVHAFSPDGKTLAVLGRTGDIVLFDADRGTVRGRFPAVARNPIAMGFAADGKKFIACFGEGNAIYEFDLTTLADGDGGA